MKCKCELSEATAEDRKFFLVTTAFLIALMRVDWNVAESSPGK